MIFISFLGTGNYSPCKYFYEKPQYSKETKYIQNALRDILGLQQARSLLFVTEQARIKHLTPLQDEAKEQGLPPMEPVNIPMGSSEEQLWEIFSIISQIIPEESEIIFDITHSFRSLPLLMTILLNYLETVKNIRNIKCYYGAYEARETQQKIEIAPIFNLSSFFTLNHWTQAIHTFINHGDTKQLNFLIEKELHSILRNPGQQKESAILLRKTSAAIHEFSSFIHTANCHSLCEINIKKRISDRLAKLNNPNNPAIILPLTPVMKKLEELFQNYENQSLFNGLRAAHWCSQLGLVPQCITILQEVIVSIELEKQKEKILDAGVEDGVPSREFISHLLGLPPTTSSKEWKGSIAKHSKIAKEIHSEWDKEFLSLYSQITQCRNSINHGGTNPNGRIASKIREKLADFVERTMVHYGVEK